MGFFKGVTLRYRAQRIADAFSKLRSEQFDSTVRCIELRPDLPIVIRQRTLGGDADRALKGYQLLLAAAFFARHPGHIAESAFEEFGRNLSVAVIGSVDDRVLDFLNEFRQHIGDLSQQLVSVAFPIAQYIAGEPDAMAATIVAQLLPIFSVNSQIVVASVFGDRESVKGLESEMQAIRQSLTGA